MDKDEPYKVRLLDIVNHSRMKRGLDKIDLTIPKPRLAPKAESEPPKEEKKEEPKSMIDTNIWKEVAPCPGYYVNRKGEVISTRKDPAGKLLTPNRHPNGHVMIDMADPTGKRKSISLSRVVTEAFIGKIPDNKIVKHKDGNPANNKVDNLEIADRKDIQTLRKTSKKIVAWNLRTGHKHIYSSYAKASQAFELSPAYIRALCDDDKKQYKAWQFLTYLGKDEPDNTVVFLNGQDAELTQKPIIKKETMIMNDEMKKAMEMATKITASTKLEPEKPKVDFGEICKLMMDGITKTPKDVSAENVKAFMVGYATCMQIAVKAFEKYR